VLLALQALIFLTGNYTFFNILTAALTLFLFDDQALRWTTPWIKRRPEPARSSRRALIGAAVLTAVLLPMGLARIMENDVHSRLLSASGQRTVPQVFINGRSVGGFTDISALKATQRKLEHLAGADMLTGLPNRRTFHERMHQLVQNARRRGARFGLMYVDLDGFKRVNDCHGHEAGDRLLQRMADLLRASVRGGDTAFRVGGDEFTVLLENVANAQEAVTVAERIIAGVEAAFGAGAEPADIGASIGIALYPAGGDDVPTLLRNADAAMYRAKSSGRNGYRMYTAATAANVPDDTPQLADVA